MSASTAGSYKTVRPVPASVRRMQELVGLVVFAFVSSITPGPNNVLLWASGTVFGLRATVPHILGTAVGICAMAVAVAAGIGAVVTAVPLVGLAMKIGGSLYLVYLAIQIARSDSLNRAQVARPLGLLQAAALQVINPKAWIFAVGAVTTFRPPELPYLAGSLLVAGVMGLIILPTAALWAGAGGMLGRFIETQRSRRIVGLILAAMLLATIASVWL